MRKKTFTTNLLLNMKRFSLFGAAAIIPAVIAAAIRLYYMGDEGVLMSVGSLSGYILLLFVWGYLAYVARNLQIDLTLDDNGLTYESSKRRKWSYFRSSTFLPWEAVKGVSLGDDAKGSMMIETSEGQLTFCHPFLDKNREIAHVIENRIKHSQART